MYSVTFRSERRKTSRYKTESGAIRAIWNWLKRHDTGRGCSATLIGPGMEPRVFDDWRDVPYMEPVKADFYSSTQWLRLRYEVLAHSEHKCALCGATPESGAVMHVDHIQPRSLRPDLALAKDNLQILCDKCNLGKSNRSNDDWRKR